MASKANFTPAEEEAIIRTRYLTQAVTTPRVQPPPLKVLTRKLLSLVESAEKAINPEALDKPLKELLRELAMMDLQARKLQAVCDANEREQHNYRVKQGQVLDSIAQTRLDISSRKVELQEARVQWEHNQEYEALRGKVMEVPTRPSMKLEMKRLRASMRGVRAEEERINQTIELRRKQFALLLHSIDELQRLDDDDGAAPGSLEVSEEEEEEPAAQKQLRVQAAAQEADAAAAEANAGAAATGMDVEGLADGSSGAADAETGLEEGSRGSGQLEAAAAPQQMDVDG